RRRSQWKRSVRPLPHQLSRPRDRDAPRDSRFVASRVTLLKSVPLPPACSAFRHLSDLAVRERRRRYPGNGRILREASEWLASVEAPLPPSDHAIHLSRSDITNRARCLPALRGFVASKRAPGNVPPAQRDAIPGLCAATKVRLESPAANRVLHPP